MPEISDSLKIFLSIWLTELKHETKKIIKNKVKFIITLILAVFFMAFLFAGFYRIINYVKDTPIVGMALVGRLIGTVFLALFLLLIYSSTINGFSTLYFSGDNNFIMISPLHQSGVLLGRLIQTSFYASWMSAVVIIPLLFSIGVIFKIPLYSYLIIIAAILLFFIIATCVGVTLDILVVKIFPARKFRDLLIVGLVILGTGLYVLFRILNIEQVLRPGKQSLAASYLKAFEVPGGIYLPTHWITRIFIEFINKTGEWLVPIVVVLGYAVLTVIIFYIVSKYMFYPGWEKVQSEERKRYVSNSFPKNPVLGKDIKSFFRDTSQWTQLLIIGALIVIYIFNIYKLPLDIPFFHYIITFFNIGMVAFVVAAVGLRFAFSSISLEGREFWILLSSSLDVKKIMKYKYLENFIPLEILGIILVLASNYILKPPQFLNIMSIITVAVAGITLTSLGIGIGAMYPKFDTDNPGEIETSWGGILYMIYSFFYIGITLALEAGWTRMYFLSRVRDVAIYYPAVIGIIISLIIINIIANYLPLKIGLRNMRRIEFTV